MSTEPLSSVSNPLERIGSMIASNGANSRRALHGRGHCYPGFESVTVDLFAPVVWVSLFSKPVAVASESESGPSSSVLQADLDTLLASIVEFIPGSAFDCVMLQHRYERPCCVTVAYGKPPQTVFARENEARYELMLEGNQNIGFFLDAEPARTWLRKNCSDQIVLNLFAYTCAFSVAAVQGGANSVVNMDMSRNAMRVGERNHKLNFGPSELRQSQLKFFPNEIFRSVSRLRKHGPYDIIVLDPPSMQPGSFEIDKDYPKLLRKLPRLLKQGGTLLCMLNSPNRDQSFLEDIVREQFPALQLRQRLNNSADFPDACSQGQLKMLLFDLPRNATPEKSAVPTAGQTQAV